MGDTKAAAGAAGGGAASLLALGGGGGGGGGADDTGNSASTSSGEGGGGGGSPTGKGTDPNGKDGSGKGGAVFALASQSRNLVSNPSDDKDVARRLQRYASVVDELLDYRVTCKTVSQSHFNAQRRYEEWVNWLNVMALVCGVAATALPASTVFSDVGWSNASKWQPLLASFFAFMTLVCQHLSQYLNAKANSHSRASASWLTLMTQTADLTSLLTAAIPTVSMPLDTLNAEWAALEERKMQFDNDTRDNATVREDMDNARAYVRASEWRARQNQIANDQYDLIFASAAAHRVAPGTIAQRAPLPGVAAGQRRAVWRWYDADAVEVDDGLAGTFCCCLRRVVDPREREYHAQTRYGYGAVARGGGGAAEQHPLLAAPQRPQNPQYGRVFSAGGGAGGAAASSFPIMPPPQVVVPVAAAARAVAVAPSAPVGSAGVGAAAGRSA